MKDTQHRSPYADTKLFTCERISSGGLSGGYHCYTTVNNTQVFMNYLYYTKREAVARFKEHLQEKATYAFIK